MRRLGTIVFILLAIWLSGCNADKGTDPEKTIEYSIALHDETFNGILMHYAVRVPETYVEGTAAPLILALHYGAGNPPPINTCQQFLYYMVMPGLSKLRGIFVAPNCPTSGGWTVFPTEKAVMALVDTIRARYTIDPEKILVMGYSMGGFGTWHMITYHSDLFSAAIPMASYPTADAQNFLPDVPVYTIIGEEDDLFDIDEVKAIIETMQAGGMQIVWHMVKGASHLDTEPYVKALKTATNWVLGLWGD